ncbi:hypothetical protein DFH29DRAFT_1053587 [Suillus ampliporus]|nr:hypothetical protein DFH29DRAFT_1053587 [Suillus ampliporus]
MSMLQSPSRHRSEERRVLEAQEHDSDMTKIDTATATQRVWGSADPCRPPLKATAWAGGSGFAKWWARPKPYTGHYFGLARPGSMGAGFGWPTARSRAMHITKSGETARKIVEYPHSQIEKGINAEAIPSGVLSFFLYRTYNGNGSATSRAVQTSTLPFPSHEEVRVWVKQSLFYPVHLYGTAVYGCVVCRRDPGASSAASISYMFQGYVSSDPNLMLSVNYGIQRTDSETKT